MPVGNSRTSGKQLGGGPLGFPFAAVLSMPTSMLGPLECSSGVLLCMIDVDVDADVDADAGILLLVLFMIYTRTSWYYRKNDDSLRFHVTMHAYMCGHMQDRACIPPCLHHSITPHADSDRLCVPSQDGSVARFALTKLFKVSHMRSKWVQKVLLINRSPALPLPP